MDFETIIGLEVHVQLKTKSKMFCRCDNRDDQAPNTAICPICTAQPGALPLPNAQAIDWTIMTCLALGCKINQTSKFDRKSYFYPDLPKGYQISQFDQPFGYDGQLTTTIDGQPKTFRIHRLHLEEDAGKLIHSGKDTLVDLNRSGTPLMEIVSEPDFRSPQEAKAYMQELRLIMRYLGVSDADMEKGHLRCDANISLRPVGSKELFPKTEIKNINSFKAVERALIYEIDRQRALWEDGQQPMTLATRGWNEDLQQTVEQRTKEEAADYRYFPEPDLPSIITSDEHLAELRKMIPELPAARRKHLAKEYQLTPNDIDVLVNEKELTNKFEEAIKVFHNCAKSELGDDKIKKEWDVILPKAAKQISNFIINRISGEFFAAWGFGVRTDDFGQLMWMQYKGEIDPPITAKIFEQMRITKKSPQELLTSLGLQQINDIQQLITISRNLAEKNPKIKQDYKAGKKQAKQALIGLVMRDTKGSAKISLATEAAETVLEE